MKGASFSVKASNGQRQTSRRIDQLSKPKYLVRKKQNAQIPLIEGKVGSKKSTGPHHSVVFSDSKGLGNKSWFLLYSAFNFWRTDASTAVRQGGNFSSPDVGKEMDRPCLEPKEETSAPQLPWEDLIHATFCSPSKQATTSALIKAENSNDISSENLLLHEGSNSWILRASVLYSDNDHKDTLSQKIFNQEDVKCLSTFHDCRPNGEKYVQPVMNQPSDVQPSDVESLDLNNSEIGQQASDHTITIIVAGYTSSDSSRTIRNNPAEGIFCPWKKSFLLRVTV